MKIHLGYGDFKDFFKPLWNSVKKQESDRRLGMVYRQPAIFQPYVSIFILSL